MPLNRLSNFQGLFKIPLINCKVELKLKSTKHCILAAASNKNTNDNPDTIIFTTKDTKLYVPAVTLSAKINQKLPKLLSKKIGSNVSQ